MALAESTVNRMMDELEKGRPPEALRQILRAHAEKRIQICKRIIKKYESRYGTFEALQEKVVNRKHSMEEERAVFSWEAALTELKRLKKILQESS